MNWKKRNFVSINSAMPFLKNNAYRHLTELLFEHSFTSLLKGTGSFSLHEKYPNAQLFLVRIFVYSVCVLSWALFDGFICMMEKVNFGSYIKNIPIPSKRTYLLQLMEKFELVITRMRWKAIHFNNNDSTDNNVEDSTERYGLKWPCSPRQVKELIPFEDYKHFPVQT